MNDGRFHSKNGRIQWIPLVKTTAADVAQSVVFYKTMQQCVALLVHQTPFMHRNSLNFIIDEQMAVKGPDLLSLGFIIRALFEKFSV